MSDSSFEGDPATLDSTSVPAGEFAPLQAQDAYAPSAPSIAEAEKPKGAMMRLLGIALALGGIALAVAPHVSAKAAQLLASLQAPEVCGGLLCGAGLGLILVSVLQRTLQGIRGSIVELRNEASRLDAVSHDTRLLCATVERVEIENQDLRSGVSGLEKQLGRLTEIASNPDNSVSMFRLAASVDQLGAKLDGFIKEQFKTMRQQLVGVVESAQQAEQSLGKQLRELAAFVREQDLLQLQALGEGFTRSQTDSARTLKAIASLHQLATGIESRVAEHKQALSSAVESITLDRLQATEVLQAELAGTRDGLQQTIQEQQTRVAAELAHIDEALQRSGRERDTLARELAASLRKLVESHSEELRNSFGPVVESTRRTGQVETQLLDSLAAHDAHATEQSHALQSAFEAGLERVQSASTHAGLATEESLKAAARLEASLFDCRETLTRSLESAQERWSAEALQIGGAQQRALEAQMQLVASRLGQIERSATAAQERWSTEAQQIGGAQERVLREQMQSIFGKLEQLDQALGIALEDWSAQAVLLGGSQERALKEQMHGVTAKLDQIEQAVAAAQTAQSDGTQERALQEQLRGVGGKLEQIERFLEAAREGWSEQAVQLGGAQERALKDQMRGVSGKLEQIEHALEAARESWSAQPVQSDATQEHALQEQLADVAGRLEHELNSHSARLEQLSDMLIGFAHLAAQDRQMRADGPAAEPRQLSFGSPEPVQVALAPSAPIVLPEFEPPPALPTTNQENRSDLLQ